MTRPRSAFLALTTATAYSAHPECAAQTQSCPHINTFAWDASVPISAAADVLTNFSRAREPAVWTGVPLPEGFDGGTCESMPRSGTVMRMRRPVFDWEQREVPLAFLEDAQNEWVQNAPCTDFFATDAYTYSTEQVFSAEGCGSARVTGTCSEATPSARAAADALAVREGTDAADRVGLWMTARGVVTAAHTDLYHNAVLQLAGTKRWTLAPASESMRLRPFPHPHPRARRSQAGLAPLRCGEPGAVPLLPEERLPTARDARGDRWAAATATHQVVLRPGDLLYLPPLTYHRVEAPPDGSLTIGLNAFSLSSEMQASDEGLALLNEFLEWADGTATSAAMFELLLVTFIHEAVPGVLRPRESGLASPSAEATVADFLRPALSSKWSALYTALGCHSFRVADCPSVDAHPAAAPLRKQCARFAERLARLFSKYLGGLAWSPDNAKAVRELILMQLVEYATTAAGPNQCVMLRCLASQAR